MSEEISTAMKKGILHQTTSEVKCRPSANHPKLLKKLARINLLVSELHSETFAAELGDSLDISKQSMQYHIDKEKI